MKVKLLTRWLAVPGKNPGDMVDLPDAQAQDGIARGICKKAGKDPEVDLKAGNGQPQAENKQLKDLVADFLAADQETQIQQLTAMNKALEATGRELKEIRAENEQLQAESKHHAAQLDDTEAMSHQLTAKIAENEKLEARIAELEAQATDQVAEETKPAKEKAGDKGKDAKSRSGKGETK